MLRNLTPRVLPVNRPLLSCDGSGWQHAARVAFACAGPDDHGECFACNSSESFNLHLLDKPWNMLRIPYRSSGNDRVAQSSLTIRKPALAKP
jgi:hypothetical protein